MSLKTHVRLIPVAIERSGANTVTLITELTSIDACVRSGGAPQKPLLIDKLCCSVFTLNVKPPNVVRNERVVEQ